MSSNRRTGPGGGARDEGGLTVLEKQAKSVLNRRKRVNDWLWDRYSVNPYEGCAHACEYCDAVSHRYHLHPDFHRTVYAKTNAPEVLQRQISRLRGRDVVALSGVTEPYQAPEARYRITRRCLEVLLEYGFPVHILTKSTLVTRDSDVLKELQQDTALRVSVTVPTMDEGIARLIEPRAPSPEARLGTVEKLAGEGLVVGVLLIPLIPHLLDHRENIESVVKAASSAGAAYVLFGGLSLHDRQRERWFEFLRARYPDLEARFRCPSAAREKAALREAAEICRGIGMPCRIPRPIVAGDRLGENKRVAETLYRTCYEMDLADAPKHQIWARRKTAWALDDLEEDVRDLVAQGRLESVAGIGPVLAEEIKRILANRRSK